MYACLKIGQEEAANRCDQSKRRESNTTAKMRKRQHVGIRLVMEEKWELLYRNTSLKTASGRCENTPVQSLRTVDKFILGPSRC